MGFAPQWSSLTRKMKSSRLSCCCFSESASHDCWGKEIQVNGGYRNQGSVDSIFKKNMLVYQAQSCLNVQWRKNDCNWFPLPVGGSGNKLEKKKIYFEVHMTNLLFIDKLDHCLHHRRGKTLTLTLYFNLINWADLFSVLVFYCTLSAFLIQFYWAWHFIL